MKHTEKVALAMAWYDSGVENRFEFQTLIESLLVQPERHELQAKGEHPAPCARHCEANAFQIVIKNLKAQLAQTQELVATDWNAVHEKLGLVWFRELSADEGLDEIQDLINTTPPQRKPLTDDELANIWFKQSTDWIEFARAIEAAHGIKENT